MNIEKTGGIAALILAFTYVFGMVFFFGVMAPETQLSGKDSLQFYLDNKDGFFIGHLVIGFVFGFAMLGLAQAMHFKLKPFSPQLSQYGLVLGTIWGTTLLFATAAIIVGLKVLTGYFAEDPEQALTIYRAAGIVDSALGGGIEIFGGAWVLVVTLIALKHQVFNRWFNYLGLFVAVAGIISIFSVMSFAEGNVVFELITMIFGLGQIPWFIWLGCLLIRSKPIENTQSLLEAEA